MSAKRTVTVEIETLLPFFVWCLNLNMEETPQEQIERYGFANLKDACQFWVDNRDAFRPHLGENQFSNVDGSVEATLLRIG